MDVDDGSGIDLVDKFCYLGDLVSTDGGADVAVIVTIWTCWNNFRQLAPLLTAKGPYMHI